MLYASDFKHLHLPEEIRRPEKPLSWRAKLSLAVEEYCQQSTLHGLKYIGDSTLPAVDRLLWLVIFLGSCYMSVVLTWELYWTSDQVQMAFNPISTPVWNIPFPAVLVCSMYSIKKSSFDIEKSNNTKYRHFSKLVCPAKDEILGDFNDTIDEDFFNFVVKAGLPCEDFIKKCIMDGVIVNCCTIFKPVLSSRGLCYQFNSLPGEVLFEDYSPLIGSSDIYDERSLYWDIDTGYPNRTGNLWKKVYPFWSENAGVFYGLTFDLLDMRHEWQQICSGSSSGFELKIYAPLDHYFGVTGLKVAYGMHSHIVINPTLITSDDNMKLVPLPERNCLLKDEHPLEYFKIYSLTACHLECVIHSYLNHCGCVPFSSHAFVGVWNYKYCNGESLLCQKQILDNVIMKSITNESECFCLSPCSTLIFDYQVGSQQLSAPRVFPLGVDDDTKNSSRFNTSRVSLYYSVQQFNSLTRRNTRTLSTVFGALGGLLGLLLGFSFMSAQGVELQTRRVEQAALTLKPQAKAEEQIRRVSLSSARKASSHYAEAKG